MKGYYLGEIVFENRLLYCVNNGYWNIFFGIYGNYGNVGNYGNFGNYGVIGIVVGFKDIEIDKLK